METISQSNHSPAIEQQRNTVPPIGLIDLETKHNFNKTNFQNQNNSIFVNNNINNDTTTLKLKLAHIISNENVVNEFGNQAINVSLNSFQFTNNINDSNSNSNKLNNSNNSIIYQLISSTPAPSISKQLITIKTLKSEKTINRNGKDSVIRAALRVAARQGLEAMVELYDKKEPNLLRRGKVYIHCLTFILFIFLF